MTLSGMRRFLPVALTAAACAIVIPACGSSDSSSSSTTSQSVTATKDEAIAAKVPAKFQGKALVVGSDASYAPMEFIGDDGKTVVGADVDLANALATTMGLKADVQNAPFDGILNGIKSGKYGLGMSSFTDTKEREQEVDFVTYFRAGTSFYTPAGKATVTKIEDLCGLTVTAQKGTTQADEIAAQNKKCPADKQITALILPDQNAVNLAVTSGRAQAAMADSPVAAYAVKQSGDKLELSGKSYNDAPYGIALPKGSGLDQPLLDALKALIASGAYKQILDKWGLSAGAITDPKVNGAES
jgi:polar amino acid transport system substrate-binding protein